MNVRPSRHQDMQHPRRQLAGTPILVVDDDVLNCRLLESALVSRGCDVRTAPSPAEAMELLRGFRPRLVFVDLRPRARASLDLARRIKRSVLMRDVLVVGMGREEGDGMEGQARAVGCDGYLVKPVDVHSIAGDLARRLFGGHREGHC
jgi:two-component system, cell cycle response regulator DivK